MNSPSAPLSGIYRSSADLYEAIYSRRGKDYAREAGQIAALVRERRPGAASLLDVACGTGSHLEHLSAHFEHVEGIDLAPDMVRVARAKLADVPVHIGDMRDFRIDGRFDVITCMFSSIGYAGGERGLVEALDTFARHLAPGGVIVLEPWYFPETALDRHVVGDVMTVGDRTIARVSHAVREEGAHRMRVHYVVADPAEGIRAFEDEHVLAIIERGIYEKAFAAVGCDVDYVETEGPGLFVATSRRNG
ncbi:methyltransferase domain-containing protein [Nocardiopsis sp. NPDC006139]|uniref:class I SAM-dependent DNA methyltransferase n=1 Tax=unclassified Nocardiopsis TaxID=2649073 RepID=UPI0033BF3960